MTVKDIRHYKFLRRAIEFKYRFPNQSAFETFSYDPYIFRWASNTFYELKLFDYLDIRERVVLVRLYENLKKDPRLKFLDDPDSLKNKIEFKLPESFHAKIESEQAKLPAQTPQAAPLGGTATQNTQPASGRGPAFRPPTLPSTSTVSSTTKAETKKTPGANVKLPRISFGAGNILRNLGSQSSIFLKRHVFGKILTPTRLVTGFTTILGGIAGAGFGSLGAFAGAGAGFLAPSYVKTFGTRHLTRAAHWGADSMVRLSSQTSRFSMGGFGGRSVTGKRFAIAAILLFLGVGALAAFAPLPGQETLPAAAAPLPSAIVSSCPAAGKISAPYGYNFFDPFYPDVENEGCDSSLKKCHNGIDIAAIEGSLVKSPISGTVTFIGVDCPECFKGNYVEITDATGLIATFEHLSSITTTLNTVVSKGTIIGAVGHTGKGVTGPVLHYKIRKGGTLMNPFRTFGGSATLDPKVLTSSDEISQNNYNNGKPDDPSGYWGECK